MPIPGFLLDQTAVVKHYETTVDAKNFPVRGVVSEVSYPCRLELQGGVLGSVEDQIRRDTVTSQKTLFLPPTAVVGADDDVAVDGVTYKVDGEPNRLRAFGRLHHLEVALRVVRDAADA